MVEKPPKDFLEIEHKFLVDEDFDPQPFFQAAHKLGPVHTTAVVVEDTYFLTALSKTLLFRHRYDSERQELTVKSYGDADPEVRMEVNLRLDQGKGNQLAAVKAFLAPFSIRWQGTLKKDLHVFEYKDCEVVYYAAQAADRRARCVEFEAIAARDVESAKAVLSAYEQRLGFAQQQRSRQSLFDLLLRPSMGDSLFPITAAKDKSFMDILFLEGLEVPCRVGCTPPERETPQSLRVDVQMYCPSLELAGQKDDLSATVDYRIANDMIREVQGREFLLIERVAEVLAQVALRDPQVAKVQLTVRKRPPVQGLELAGVQITRSRS